MNDANPKMTRQRQLLIGLLFLHTVNTFMDRICISTASDLIMSDLNISEQMMGYIFAIFAVSYALFQVPAGWFADTYGPKKALLIVVGFWSSFTALTGAAWNHVTLLVVRFFFGAGEAGAFPGATRAVFNWVPAKERGLANGIFHSGGRVGAALSLSPSDAFLDWCGGMALDLCDQWRRGHPLGHGLVFLVQGRSQGPCQDERGGTQVY